MRETDQRVIKTKAAIKRAFLELMQEEGFMHINVKKIVERAQINRGTFYLHYLDKYDLLDQIENELLEGFRKCSLDSSNHLLRGKQIHINWEDVEPIFTKFADYVYENGELFTLLQSKNGDPAFTAKFNEMCKLVWVEHHLDNRLAVPQNYALDAFISMLCSLISDWVQGGFKETKEEFQQIVFKIVNKIPDCIFL